jgi:hypothetical protein
MSKKLRRKIGDIIECCDKYSSKYKNKGIIICKYETIPPSYYIIYWFSSGKLDSVFEGDVKKCEGIGNNMLCSNCKNMDLCQIARCEFGEFGQLRGEGKYNPDLCWQRKCIHTSACLANRWLEKS